MNNIVTKQEFQNYIKRQKNDRPVDMRQSTKTDKCGCVMIHFGKSRKFKFDWCGFTLWGSYSENDHNAFARFENEMNLREIIKGGILNKSRTYGELKKQLIP